MAKGRCSKRRFKDLSPAQRAGVLALGSVQLALLATALVDLSRRPADEVRGKKAAWFPALFINFFGPLAYLKFGRKR